jgi:hypothetical protein
MEIKGFILWNKDLKRVGYVHKTKEAAELARFKKSFMDAYAATDKCAAGLTRRAIEELADRALSEEAISAYEVKEVRVTFKETEE